MPRNRLTRAGSAGAARAIRFDGASARPGVSYGDRAIPLREVQRLLVTIVACVLATTTAAAARQLVITERDSGKTFTVRRGTELTLRLSSRYRWLAPKVKGRAARLIPVDYFVDPGFREWQVDGVGLGRSRITAAGYDQACTAACPARRFYVVIIVRPRLS